ncbi:MAG: lysophospholipid acyltransferase family protein [Gaiellaceae bacterium]
MIIYRFLNVCGYRPAARAVYRMEIAGGERIPAEGPCILVANHESVIDPFVLGLATPRIVRFMAKAELWRSASARAVMEGLAAFPVDRGRGDFDAFGRAERLLSNGEILGIFAQGTCKPLRRRPFLRGAARLALETGSPLVPVALVGTEQAVRPHRLRLGLPRIRVLVGRPFEVGKVRPTVAAARELTRRIDDAVADLRRPYGEPRHAWIDNESAG